MGVYKSARKLLNEMIQDIVTNQFIMKYVVYDRCDIDPLALPNIDNPIQYLYNPQNPNPDNFEYRIFQIPKIPTVEETKKTIITGRIFETKEIRNNPYFKDYVVAFDIISHIDLWAIKGGLIRPLEIMELINELYNQKYTTNSMKPLYPKSDPYIQYNNLFCGYRLIYEATNKNKNSCG